MKEGRELAAVAFGIPEFGFSMIFSMPIWLDLKFNIIVPSIVLFVILSIATIVTVWQMFNRKSACAYLIAFGSRMFYLGSVFAICQISGFFGDEFKSVWFVITIILFIFGSILHFKCEKKYWENTLAEWEEIDKINVAKGYFRIYEAFQSHSQSSWEDLKIVFTIIPVGTIILTVVMGILGNNFKMAFVHFIMTALGYFCVFMFGRILAWITEIRKLENELGVTFVTEYGMAEEKGKRRRRK